MKKLRNIIMLSLLGFSTFAGNCESVDAALVEYKLGFLNSTELSKIIECNLTTVTSPKTLCHTKVGLQKDQLIIVQRMYDYGMVSLGELKEAKATYSTAKESCK